MELHSESKGLRTSRADRENPSPAAGEDPSPAGAGEQEGDKFFLPLLFFRSGPQGVGRGPPTPGRAVYFYESSTNLIWKPSQARPK